MATEPLNVSLNYLPRLPRRKDFRIGCIGAGFIMRDCHLVAYRQAGFDPIAISSRTPERAAEVAKLHGLPRVYATYQELIADKDIEVVDIAVPPDLQLSVIRDVVKHADHVKGILAQKPLAMSIADAKEAVRLCEDASITLAVNHNMRFDQSVRAMKDILQRGWLGEPVFASIDMRAIPHWMPWAEGQRSLSTFIMSIHHLDTFRYWLGTPQRVLASTRPDPRTKFPHQDGINLYILEYANGCRASSWDDVWTGPAREGSESDIRIHWRVEGTDGLARGTIGWPSYPARTPSTLDFTTRLSPLPPGGRGAGVEEGEPSQAPSPLTPPLSPQEGEGEKRWFQPRWKEVWFPDAFIGTMAQLLVALEEGAEPEISGRDNLETIALCEAVLASATEHRVCTVGEFLGKQ